MELNEATFSIGVEKKGLRKVVQFSNMEKDEGNISVTSFVTDFTSDDLPPILFRTGILRENVIL